MVKYEGIVRLNLDSWVLGLDVFVWVTFLDKYEILE